MQELIVIATLSAKPGHEAVIKAAVERIVPPTRAEDGCTRYDPHIDLEHPGRYVIVEAWRDAEAHQRHLATPHFLELVKTIDGLADIQILKLNQLL
ncbi:putative quinol monooxygenase [Duganella sp. HH101]|uniref:putative quinol monooxygenase n=1 Tax=Duganella sp. HH101 TaxID=1781066 RepID=UPI00087551B8|nr:putative quinol monooxygenase [Duganella sp. HH101]OFA03083.1 putative monooxygenase [Duganella sp. HH101]